VSPFHEVAGVRYIEEAWAQRLFLMDIEKSEAKISITTTAQ